MSATRRAPEFSDPGVDETTVRRDVGAGNPASARSEAAEEAVPQGQVREIPHLSTHWRRSHPCRA